MTIIELTRKLGEELQKDERYLAFAAAKEANDNDEELQKKIGEFNLVKMSIDQEITSENKSQDKINELNDKLGNLYNEIMTSEPMLKYNEAREGLDGLISEINGIITLCANGADPKTCEPSACTGNCASCGGCH